MFGQTFGWSDVFALLALFFMLVAVVTLYWRPSRVSPSRKMVGGSALSLAWLIIGIQSHMRGDELLLLIGLLLSVVAAYVTYRDHKLQQQSKGLAIGSSIDEARE